MVAPCKDCEKRGCGSYHDQCEKYQEFQMEMKKIQDQHVENKRILDYIWDRSKSMKTSRNTNGIGRSRKK